MKRRVIAIVVVVAVVAGLAVGIYKLIDRGRGEKLLTRAQLKLQAGDLNGALDLAGSYVKSNPGDWRGHLCQGQAYARLKRFAEAREALGRAAGLNPKELSITTATAETYSLPARELIRPAGGPPKQKDLEEAIDLFGQADEYLADRLNKVKGSSAPAAADDAKLVLDISQQLGLNLRELGEAEWLLADQQEKEAEIAAGAAAAEQAAESDLKSRAAYDRAGTHLAKATGDLLEVLKADFSSGRAAAIRAAVEMIIERNDDKAQADLAEIHKLLDKNGDACPAAVMRVAQYEFDRNSASADPVTYCQGLAELARSFDGLLARHPNETEIKLARAAIALTLGDKTRVAATQPVREQDLAGERDRARQLCDEVIKADPRNLVARLLLARLIALRGNRAEAEAQLLALKTENPWVAELQYWYAKTASSPSGSGADSAAGAQGGGGDHQSLVEEAWRRVITLAPAQPRGVGERSLVRHGVSPAMVAEARRHMIQLLVDKKAYDEAFRDAQAYYLAAPDDEEAVRMFVETAKATNRNAVVNAALAKTLVRFPKQPQILLTVATGLRLLGDRAAEAKVYEQAMNCKASTFAARLAVAQAMTEANRTAEADSLLTQMAEQFPNSPQVKAAQYILCLRTGRAGQAVEYIRAAVRLDEGDMRYRAALARVELAVGWLDECLSECQEILRLDPSNVQAAVLISQVKIIRGEAVDLDASRPSAGQPTDRESRLRLAVTFLRTGHPDKCVDICLTELNSAADDRSAQQLLGQAYLALGKPDKAAEQWADLLKATPERLGLYKQIAAVLRRVKKPEEVKAWLAGCAGARPDLIDAAIGWTYERSGQFEQAADAYKLVLDRKDLTDDLRAEVALLRAQSLLRMGKLDEAMAQVDSQVNASGVSKPWATKARLAKAQLLLAARKPEQAGPILADLAVDAARDKDLAGLMQIAGVYAAGRQTDDALAIYDRMQHLAPNDNRGYSAKAALLARAGRVHESIKYYQMAKDRDPNSLALNGALAEALNSDQQPLEALAVYDQLRDRGQGSDMEGFYKVNALYMKGRMFARWGLFEQARECFEQAGQSAGPGHEDNPRIQLALGEALLRLGKSAAARAALDKVSKAVDQYLPAQLLLVELADRLDDKLAALDRLEQKVPGQSVAVVRRINLLLPASRPDEAVKAFSDFAGKYAKDRPLPAELYGPGMRAMLAAGKLAEAGDLAIRAVKQTRSIDWRAIAILLTMDGRPKLAAGLMPEASKAELTDALLGLVMARSAGEPLDKWTARLAELVPPAAAKTPAARELVPDLILADLIAGSPAKAKQRLAEADSGYLWSTGRDDINQQIAASQDNPRAPAAAATLLKAAMATRLGVTEQIGRTWALGLLNEQPTCRWAAAIVQMQSDPAAQQKAVATLTPTTCPIALVMRASLLSSAGRAALHVEAADLYGQAAEAVKSLSLTFRKGNELDVAGKFDQALAVYRQVWKDTLPADPPPAGNQPAGAEDWKTELNAIVASNCAYLACRLSPQEAKDSAEVARWLDVAGKAKLGVHHFAVLDTRGWIRHLQGKNELALSDLRQAADASPDSPEIHYHLAVVEAAVGHTDFARWHLKAAVNVGERLKAAGKPTPAGDAQAVEEAGKMLGQMGN